MDGSPCVDGIMYGTSLPESLFAAMLLASMSVDVLTGPESAEFLTTSRSLLT